jgi:hypothetical protein
VAIVATTAVVRRHPFHHGEVPAGRRRSGEVEFGDDRPVVELGHRGVIGQARVHADRLGPVAFGLECVRHSLAVQDHAQIEAGERVVGSRTDCNPQRGHGGGGGVTLIGQEHTQIVGRRIVGRVGCHRAAVVGHGQGRPSKSPLGIGDVLEETAFPGSVTKACSSRGSPAAGRPAWTSASPSLVSRAAGTSTDGAPTFALVTIVRAAWYSPAADEYLPSRIHRSAVW